ncbi:WRKY transcription factor 55 isoform X2 [Ricinus communis]|uniref:WRKY transcription factor 55 isoform X2 n=1 Tax=Ricinus communis TaxID=3988 RepID=UPI000D695A48|nr:WRKY transcription factor 55 isoform X2 [Ricinus communis]|eukprot:XP_025013413.1 WRKY transcription factor 55 isoform X2 [Ricinus communis]
MDEFISLILHGVKLAKDLEPSLQNLATQQDMLSKLDEIIRVFITARKMLNAQDSSSHHQMLFRELQQQPNQVDQTIQDWLRTKSIMELFQTQAPLLEKKSSPGGGIDIDTVPTELGGSTGVQAMASSSLQRPRRRGYYRCTHQKLYHCPAKKQVQRLDDDPYTFEVTYRGDHTCHMSSTAPSIPPPPEFSQEMMQTMAAHHPPPWLEFSLGAGGSGGSSSSTGAGPSTTTTTVHEFPVADLADVMFNSGSSSTNSMELIFTSMEDKWDRGDKNN